MGFFQARILEWVAISFSWGSSWPRNRTWVSMHCRQTFSHLSNQGSLYSNKIKDTHRIASWFSKVLHLHIPSKYLPLYVIIETEIPSVMSNSLWPHGPRVICPWNSPVKNTGTGSHSLLQGIFPVKGLNLGLLHCKQILYHLSHQDILFPRL